MLGWLASNDDLRSLREMTFGLPSSRHHSPSGRGLWGRRLSRLQPCGASPGAGLVERGTVPSSSPSKAFHCPLCPRRFGRKHVMENHVRTHTGERPFRCPSCLRDFARKDYLNYHMRTCRNRP
ncbi:uncharacterized protein LOC144158165 [Haemaphysalis longicornis]